MIEFLTVFQLIAAIAFSFLYMYRGDIRISVLVAVVGIKINLVTVILIFGPENISFMLAAYVGMIVILMMIRGILAIESVNAKKEHLLVIVFAVLVLLFVNGCSKGKEANAKTSKPALVSEIELSFVPSKILGKGKKELYVGTERGRAVHLYDVIKKKRIETISTGLYPVDMIKHNQMLYVAGKRSGRITIYNEETQENRSISTRGNYTSAIALNTEKNILYASNMGSSNISIIDLNTDKVTKRITTGKWPSDIFLSPDNKYLYITCQYTNTVEIIDVEHEQIVFTKVHTGTSPVAIISLNKKDMAILNEWEYSFNHKGSITVFSGSDYSIKDSIAIDGGAFDGVVSKSRKYLYVSIPLKDEVLFIDIKKREIVFSLQLKKMMPKWMAISEDGKRLYVTAQKGNKIMVIGVSDLI